MVEVTGKHFNKKYKDAVLCKFIKHGLINKSFQYKLGLNEDTIPFVPNECCEGGLYFFNIKYFYLYFKYGPKLAFLTIPDDARVFIEKNKFKADKLIINNIISVENFYLEDYFTREKIKDLSLKFPIVFLERNKNEKKIEDHLRINGSDIKYVSLQTLKLCEIAIENSPNAIYGIKNKSDKHRILHDKFWGNKSNIVSYATDENMEKIEMNYKELKYMKNPSLELCIYAMTINKNSYKLIWSPSYKIKLFILTIDGMNLRFFENKTDFMVEVAVKQNGYAIKYAECPTKKMVDIARENCRFLRSFNLN
jgi:hypothetical protein